MSLLELEALRVALEHWRWKVMKRYGWAAHDAAYVEHGRILSDCLKG